MVLIMLGSSYAQCCTTAGLLPLPARSSCTENGKLVLSGDFSINVVSIGSAAAGAVMASASDRFEKILFAHGGRSAPLNDKGDKDGAFVKLPHVLQSLDVSVSAAQVVAQLGTNESYSLRVNVAGAILSAPTLQGALHGLQTFAQLCRYDYDTDTVVVDGWWDIEDSPRFSRE